MTRKQHYTKANFIPLFEEAISKSGLTKRELAKRLNVTEPYIQNVLTVRTTASIIRVLELGTVLNMTEEKQIEMILAYIGGDDNLTAFCFHPLAAEVIRRMQHQHNQSVIVSG